MAQDGPQPFTLTEWEQWEQYVRDLNDWREQGDAADEQSARQPFADEVSRKYWS